MAGGAAFAMAVISDIASQTLNKPTPDAEATESSAEGESAAQASADSASIPEGGVESPAPDIAAASDDGAISEKTKTE